MSIRSAPEKEALFRAARVLGGQAALARDVGFKDRRSVWPYFNTSRPFPAELCPTVERLTRDRGEPILCEDLRPDVDWKYIRETAKLVVPPQAAAAEAGVGGVA